MPWVDGTLVATLAGVMLLLQAACWLLARGLGLRLERGPVIGGWLAPLVLLAPWLAGDPLLLPTDFLREVVPGAPSIERPGTHDLLNDVVYQFVPWELEVRRALSELRLPFWSDALGGGSSIWANPQACVVSPLAMAARALPIEHHLLGTLALKILVAFQGAWLLARVAGRSRAASLLAAAGFSLGGALASWALFPVTAAIAWVPWLACGTIRLFRRPDRRAIATTAVITTVLFVSGHPETVAFGGLFAAVSGLGLRRRAAGLARPLGAAALTAFLGFCLAAPHVVPFLALVPDSARAQDPLAEPPPAGRVSPFVPLTWFVPGHGQFVFAPLGPHVYGRPYREPFRGALNWAEVGAGYAGLVALAGAVIAFVAARDRRARPFLGFAVFGVLLAARFLPLAHLLHAFPPFRVLAVPRCLLPASLALSVAGAFGVDLLASRRSAPRAVLAWPALALAALASLAAAADAWTTGLWAGLVAALALVRLRPRIGAAALGALLLVDLVPWSRSHLPRGDPALFYPRTEIVEILEREAGRPDTGRAAGADFLLYPNLLPAYGIADFRPHDPLAPLYQLRALEAAFGFRPTMTGYFAPLRNVDHPLLDFLGVHALLASPAVAPSRTLERIDGDRFLPFTLLRNPDPLPRWFVPEAVDVIERGQVAGWIAGMTTAGRVAVLADEAGGWRPTASGTVGTVTTVASTPGHVVLEVPGEGERLLASSLVWSRGWSARSGERRLPTLTVDGAFLGVRVPGGVSRVELRFVPPGFVAGAVASGVAALGLLLLWLGPPLPSRPAA